MFRRMKKLVRAHRERMLSLVLLPAFFLATLPRQACICPDGHRERTCNALACGLGGASCSCGCTCCKSSGPTQQRSCCQAMHRHAAPPGQQPVSGLTAAKGSCCQPIMEAPAPVVSANKGALAKQIESAVAMDVVLPLFVAPSVRPGFTWTDAPDTPPLDVVIVFQRLTI